MHALVIILLVIPLLNLLVGSLIGISLVFQFLRMGLFFRLLIGLALAAFWAFLSIMVIAAHPEFESEFLTKWFTAFLFAAQVIYTILFVNWLLASLSKPYLKQLEKARAASSISFSFNEAMGSGPILCYNAPTKKIAIIYTDGFLIKDFSYIRYFNLLWVETTSGNGSISYNKVRLELNTTNIKSPRIVIPCESKNEGEDSYSRLEILFSK